MSVLRDVSRTRAGKEKKYCSYLTRLSSHEKFPRVLEFVLPGGRRKKHHLLLTERQAKSTKLILHCYSTLIKKHKVMIMMMSQSY